jgi:large subunit ribosomal protein L21
MACPRGQAFEEEKIAMFAVVRTGGKQYRVAAGDKIVVEKMAGAAGDTVSLGDVLFASDAGEVKATDGLAVSAEIIAQAKADKVIIFKKKRRHNYRRKNGHRQQHTILRILAVGAPAKQAAPKKAEAAPTDAAPVAEAPVSEAKPVKKPAAKKAAAAAE